MTRGLLHVRYRTFRTALPVAGNVRSGHDRSDRGHFFTGEDIVKPLSLVLVAAVVVAGCSSNADKTQKDSSGAAAPAAATTTSGAALTGAGATFPYPIYSKWFDSYASK